MGRLSVLGPHGYFVEFEPGDDRVAKMRELDTRKCQHCGFQVHIERKDQPQAICKRCMQFVCEKCAPRGACNPKTNPNFEELLDRIESREARKSYGF